METSAMVIVIVMGILLMIVFYIFGIYNSLINAKNKVYNHFSQIDMQMKRKNEIVLDMLNILDKCVETEKDVVKNVIDVRNKACKTRSINTKIEAEENLSIALKKMLAWLKTVDDIKGNKEFMAIKKDLKDVDIKVNYAKQFYNESATLFNNLVDVFPSSVVAKMFKFKKYDIFLDVDK